MKLTVGYFYKDLLNLYGDNGNIEALMYRSKKRGIDFDIIEIGLGTEVDRNLLKKIDVVFMGGGPDSAQKSLYKDLVENKSGFLRDYIEGRGMGLYICGAYQLLGKYYKAADGNILKGLGIFDLYTEHVGDQRKRCVGNTIVKLNTKIVEDLYFKSVCGKFSNLITGFENHGGRTYLGETQEPLGFIKKGNGNNSKDGTEGIIYKNSIGTYFHGPFLVRNPHMADYIIAKSLNLDTIKPLDDYLTYSAYTASLKLK